MMHNIERSEVRVPRGVLRSFAEVCLRNSEYDLVQGARAQSYIDLDQLFATSYETGAEDSPETMLRHVVEKIQEINRQTPFSAIVFIERGSGPVGLIAARMAIAEKVQLPAITVRPRKRIAFFALKGKPLGPGDKVVILTDVSSTGRSIVEAAERLWDKGVQVVAAIPIVDRDQGARAYLETVDIPLAPLTTLADLESALGPAS